MPYMNNPPYYITAYGLAVKHGFVGSEKKWLQSLKGEPGTGLTIIDRFETEEELRTRYPSGVTDLDGFCYVGTSESDYLLYYWDAEDTDWYAIDIHGPQGTQGEVGPAPAPVSESYAYAISESGTTPPASGWSAEISDPDAARGKYVWTRSTIVWENGETTAIYSSAYNGMDAAGAVISVNGKDGVVHLVAENIPTTGESDVQAELDALKAADEDLNEAVEGVKVLIVESATAFTGSQTAANVNTTEDPRITPDMVVIKHVLGTPSQVLSDITWNTNTEGYVKISGTFGSTGSTVKLYLAKQMTTT